MLRHFLTAMTIVSALFLSSSTFAKVPAYQCDDNITDDGYTVLISDLGEQKQHVVIIKKSKMSPQVLAAATLDLQNSVGKFRQYSNNVSDDTVSLTISSPDFNGDKFATLTYTNKIRTIDIPSNGNFICKLIKN